MTFSRPRYVTVDAVYDFQLTKVPKVIVSFWRLQSLFMLGKVELLEKLTLLLAGGDSKQNSRALDVQPLWIWEDEQELQPYPLLWLHQWEHGREWI